MKNSKRVRQGKDFRKITFFRAGSWVKHSGGNARERAVKDNEKPLIQRIIERITKK